MARAKLPERLGALKVAGKDKLLKDPAQITGRLRVIDTRPDLVSKLLPAEVLAALRQDTTNTSGPTADELKKFSPAAWLSSDAFKREALRPKTPLNLEQAREVTAEFVRHYNEVRLHSAIGYITPQNKLDGREKEIWAQRDAKLEAARHQRRLKRVEQIAVAA
jgi:hypothetical protein